MVRGTKRKATMEKITKRESAATTYTKRTYGLHSKIAQLCLITDAQIAVLATPPSANSNVSFFSFGHTSVDSIVNAYLKGAKPVREERDDHDDEDIGICFARKELGLPQWWESDRLLKSKNPEELRRAMNSILRLLAKIKELCGEDADTRQAYVRDDGVEPPMKKKKSSNETMEKIEHTEQTLVFQPGSSFNNISEEHIKTLEYNNVMTEEEQRDSYNNVNTTCQNPIMSTCDSFCVPDNNNINNDFLDVDFDQLIDLDFGFDFKTTNSSDNSEIMKMAEPVDQPLILPNQSNNAFSTREMSSHYEIDIHQLIDFDLDTSFDDSLLESTNSAMNSVASVNDGFVETNTTQETTSTTQETTNSCTLNSVACDDASALNEEETGFSDYLTQLLQF